ncbi:peptidase M20 (amidohydrolase) [Phlyctema vagabunda]|uniref:Peptidase M20 domain-containing protein 2 n=1 Tax=Phlyctema vagabunda TaxID=108571 RepID=A0ABR4P2K5_9HELO
MKRVSMVVVEDDFVHVSEVDEQEKETGRPQQQPIAFRSEYKNSYRVKGPHHLVSSYIDSINSQLRQLSLKIHDHPELNYEEVIAHKTLTEFMQCKEGWKVTPSAYGIATAFTAVYDSGRKGPVISYNAEYDALRGIGHSCGHNLIAICSVGAALAVAAAMKRNSSVGGKVVLFGTPAEEGGGGKIKLLEAGAYKEHQVDMNLISHPGTVPDSVLVRTTAYVNFQVEYFGREAHAAAAPWEGVNALDAMITAYNALSVLRQQTMPGDIIQGHITHGGAAPNIIHAYTSGIFVVRALSRARVTELKKKVDACFEAGAGATGARLKLTPIISYDDHVPNKAIGRACRDACNAFGGAIPEPDLDLIAGQSGASTDQGNISYAMPSLSLGFEIKSEAGPHNPGFAAAARTIENHLAALRIAKILAVTGLQVLNEPKLLAEAKREFKELAKKS